MADRYVICPYCDSRVNPGQAVEYVADPDPWRELWHSRCREMWQHDERLAAAMEAKK